MAAVAAKLLAKNILVCEPQANIHDLHHAIKSQQYEDAERIIIKICNANKDLNALVCKATALSLTLYVNCTRIFLALMTHSERLNLNAISRDCKNRDEPPIVTASRLGELEAVNLLLKHGADVDCVDSYKHTALWTACKQRDTKLVKLLIEHGASVHPSDDLACSPFYFCMRYSHKRLQIAQDLILHGALVNLQSTLSFAYKVLWQYNFPLFEMMLETGYDVANDKLLKDEIRLKNLIVTSELSAILDKEFNTPPSLKRQCRAAIRVHISRMHKSRNFLQHLSSLPLPKSLFSVEPVIFPSMKR